MSESTLTAEHDAIARTREVHVSEFFAGIGLARIGLENAGFRVTWSNDISAKKHRLYRANFSSSGDSHRFEECPLGDVSVATMPEKIDVAWASFPCTDLSVAGARGGLHNGESAAFWQFTKTIAHLGTRRPTCVALENVTGFATSHAGRDIRRAITALNGLGYFVDVLAIDARRFVPQSRPRLFLVGALEAWEDDPSPHEFRPKWVDQLTNDRELRIRRRTLVAPPDILKDGFNDQAERLHHRDKRWWAEDRVSAFISSLTPLHLARLEVLQEATKLSRRTAYRRMRKGIPRWEIRSDDIAGCLRTARGGSSRQAVVETGRGNVRVRWMTPNEYAILMGVPDFDLSTVRSENEAYSALGDAVCVPVVQWIAENWISPALR